MSDDIYLNASPEPTLPIYPSQVHAGTTHEVDTTVTGPGLVTTGVAVTQEPTLVGTGTPAVGALVMDLTRSITGSGGVTFSLEVIHVTPPTPVIYATSSGGYARQEYLEQQALVRALDDEEALLTMLLS